jgi:hypothetical protein
VFDQVVEIADLTVFTIESCRQQQVFSFEPMATPLLGYLSTGFSFGRRISGVLVGPVPTPADLWSHFGVVII